MYLLNALHFTPEQVCTGQRSIHHQARRESVAKKRILYQRIQYHRLLVVESWGSIASSKAENQDYNTMKQLEALTMPHSRLISIYLFTATLLLSTSGLPYNDAYRLSQNPYTWPSRAVLESQDIPARPVAPPPDPYSGNSRFSETVGRLQIYDNQGWPISGQNGYNSGYESYNYPGYQWFYNRRGLNNGYYQGYQNPAPTNPWYPVQPDNRQNNPVGQGNQNIPDFDPIIKSNPSQPNPRPNMRHVPQDDSFDDRSQDTLNSVWVSSCRVISVVQATGRKQEISE